MFFIEQLLDVKTSLQRSSRFFLSNKFNSEDGVVSDSENITKQFAAEH